MQCLRCRSPKIMKFVDGFGERRLFCRSCWGSFLENSMPELKLGQKRLEEFNTDMYYKSKFHN